LSIYNPATLGEADNIITFNDYTQSIVYRALARSASKFQIRQQDLPVPFESGSNDFLTLLGDTSYIIQGKMYPASEEDYDNGLMQLRSVCSLDLNQNDISSDEGYVPYIWEDANDSKQIFMKPLYVEISETTQQGFVQPFMIVSKVVDPTIYGAVLKTASTAQATPTSTMGTFVLPAILPAPIGIELYTVSVDANNIGTFPSYPQSITVYGPVTNPVITNSSTGEFFGVNVTLGSSDVLLIEYNKTNYSITKNGVDVSNLVQSGSTTFKIEPGDNVITLTGSLSTGAYATLNFYDAWPLA
jgi:hypothetical protein